MIHRPATAKHLLLIWTKIKGQKAERKCIFEISIWGCHLITGWRWYISVAHWKRIIFQWKPKSYCWEYTIWISKGFAPTSIFSGIIQEAAQEARLIGDELCILLANCDICLAMWCYIWHTQIISLSMWQMMIFRHFLIRHVFDMFCGQSFWNIYIYIYFASSAH